MKFIECLIKTFKFKFIDLAKIEFKFNFIDLEKKLNLNSLTLQNSNLNSSIIRKRIQIQTQSHPRAQHVCMNIK